MQRKSLIWIRNIFIIIYAAGFVGVLRGANEPLVERIVVGISLAAIVGSWIAQYYIHKIDKAKKENDKRI